MGPTLSSFSWGCAKEDQEENKQVGQEEVKETVSADNQSPPTKGTVEKQPQDSGHTAEEGANQSGLNPVYELSLTPGSPGLPDTPETDQRQSQQESQAETALPEPSAVGPEAPTETENCPTAVSEEQAETHSQTAPVSLSSETHSASTGSGDSLPANQTVPEKPEVLNSVSTECSNRESDLGIVPDFQDSNNKSDCEIVPDFQDSNNKSDCEIVPDFQDSSNKSDCEIVPDFQDSNNKSDCEIVPDFQDSNNKSDCEIVPDFQDSNNKSDCEIVPELQESTGEAGTEILEEVLDKVTSPGSEKESTLFCAVDTSLEVQNRPREEERTTSLAVTTTTVAEDSQLAEPGQDQDSITSNGIDQDSIPHSSSKDIEDQNSIPHSSKDIEDQDSIPHSSSKDIEDQNSIPHSSKDIEDQDIIPHSSSKDIEDQDSIPHSSSKDIEDQDSIPHSSKDIEDQDSIPHSSKDIEDQDSITHCPKDIEDQNSIPQASPDKMATEAAQPAAEILLSQHDLLPGDNGAIPPCEAAPAVNKVEPVTTPAEDRLSANQSPEPADGMLAESEKVNGTSSSESNGSSAAAAAAAAAGVAEKAETEGKPVAVKTKKKEDKSIEYILRALSSLNSPEEKLAALCKKYADLHEEHRVLQSSFKQQQRKMTVLQREKDQLQADHTKAVMAKSKLESLCRELQKQNKAVKEESLLRQKEEEERRKEISNKFQTTIGEIQTQMTENHEKNVKLREENHDLAGKLKKFLEQHELREQQMEKLVKHRDLENQLAEAKLQQAAAILKEEQEKHLKEKELLLLKTAESQKQNSLLEAQLSMYKERYEEFQGTINKSNDMFQKLKSEMDKMGKRIKKLEKEGAQWRAKWEGSNKALLDLAEEKTRSDSEKQMLQLKTSKLESLCRALQAELHSQKSASPLPLSAEEEQSQQPPAASPDSSENAVTTTSVPSPAATPTPTPGSTSTPPNTPEENSSRASPNPDSWPQPETLPTAHNGPITASVSAAVSVSPPQQLAAEAPQVPGEGESGESASDSHTQLPSSSVEGQSVAEESSITEVATSPDVDTA